MNDLVKVIQEDFLAEALESNNLLVISHGLRNDRLVMVRNGLNLSSYKGKPIDGYCTFENARRILGRAENLTLTDVANEAGYYIHHAHNAFNDAWANVAVFTYLKKLEATQQEEE